MKLVCSECPFYSPITDVDGYCSHKRKYIISDRMPCGVGRAGRGVKTEPLAWEETKVILNKVIEAVDSLTFHKLSRAEAQFHKDVQDAIDKFLEAVEGPGKD